MTGIKSYQGIHSGIDCFNFSHEAKKSRLSKSSPLLSQYYHNINSFRNDFCYQIFAFFCVWERSKVGKLKYQWKSDNLASNFQNIVQKWKTALIRIFLLSTLNLALIYHKKLFNNTFWDFLAMSCPSILRSPKSHLHIIVTWPVKKSHGFARSETICTR